MTGRRYIMVLLPLRLKWEPLYYYDAGIHSDSFDPFDKLRDRNDIVPSDKLRDRETSGNEVMNDLMAGDRVRVKFAGKEYVGTVTNPDASDEAAKVGESRIKPIIGVEKGLARVSAGEINLWRQVADYYLCTEGEVYKAAYPAGKVEEEEVKARIAGQLKERLAKIEEKIARARKEETRERYTRERDGILARLGMGDPPEGKGGLSFGKLRDLETRKREEIELSHAQAEAYSKIKDIFGKGKPALLRGVTGSGKTEIYMKLARETLDEGRNVLLMVPEIALSRQLEERIGRLFPDELQVSHSAETLSRRIETASFIRQRPYIVLGTRSSVFLPHRDLGLVVVDEEHDPSYKQDNPAPRYNGRETAIMLAGIFGANVLLGSATPSLESLYNCAVGRFGMVDLDKRYFDAEDADVEIIDTIAERRKNGMVGSFSRKLIGRIQSTLSIGGQVAILRERRAWAPAVQCQDCGNIPKCRRCDVALSLHQNPDGSGKLVCHYCGRVYGYSGICPECGGTFRPLGAGTQRIEEEARNLFPEARIARLDSDNSRNRKVEAGIIKDFSERKIDILIGTRMVAKGFDFSGLSLVAAIQADSLLGLQDYRADERALQLLEQFRGRSGRRSEKGLFVIQTSQPDHPVYKRLRGETGRDDSLAGFLAERKLFGYPPYSRVIGVIVKDHNLQRAELMARDLADRLREVLPSGKVCVVGPYSPAVEKVGGEHIRMARVLLPKDSGLKANKRALAEVVEDFLTARKYIGHIALDVDPV